MPKEKEPVLIYGYYSDNQQFWIFMDYDPDEKLMLIELEDEFKKKIALAWMVSLTDKRQIR